MKRIKVMNKGGRPPMFFSELAAGADLYGEHVLKMFIDQTEVDASDYLHYGEDMVSIQIPAHARVVLGTKLHFELPKDTYLQIVPKSGVSLKSGLMLSNSPGTIDADYRGEVGIILTNTNGISIMHELGTRVAQAILRNKEDAVYVEVENLSDTERDAGGYGSSGVK